MTPDRQWSAPYRLVRGEYAHRTAAPEGGARTALRAWVRGCVAILALSTSAAALELPSGQSVTLNEVLLDAVGSEEWVRFRFLAPDVDPVSDGLAEDLLHLCDTVALPYMVEHALTGDVIVVSLMDRPVPFGQADPDARQVFEAFRRQDGTCAWDAF